MHKNTFLKDYKTEIDLFIAAALKEDIGNGDHTSQSCLSNNNISRANLLVKEAGIIAGVELAKHIFKTKNETFTFETKIADGAWVNPGDVVFTVEGPQLELLATERLVLNCMQRMSGIASLTRQTADLIKQTSCTLLDTRKTTPNFRYPEKWAVLIGGGENHRMGLFDMIMIKDNHVDFCGSTAKALSKTKQYLEANNLNIPVIIEVRNQSEIKACLDFPWIHRILLDNMNPEVLKEGLKIIDRKIATEASGNITKETIVAIAETGVDYVSLGALTHSAQNMDLSLKAV
jgi:nicotinate-nucleotide pyrophosphorylase (carboxylating)